MKNFSSSWQFWLLLPISLFCLLGTGFFLVQIFSEKTGAVEETNQKETISLQSVTSSGLVNPSCLGNYQSWKRSFEMRYDAPWSTAMFDSNSHYLPSDSFLKQDLNGDTLVDFLYAYHPSYGSFFDGKMMQLMYDCVMLNNGHGWDLTYRCVAMAEYVNGKIVPVYYGDCAK